jgi:PIN domain nuclease of toxin-antitoxin system
MIVAIADTHTAIWYLFSDSRLGRAASAFIDDTIAAGDHIGVSAISIAEMVYLIEKGRIPANALNDLHTATADPKAVLRHVPLDENIAMKMSEVPRQDLPDLPDRAIAATALFYGVPVLSRIRASAIQTIW